LDKEPYTVETSHKIASNPLVLISLSSQEGSMAKYQTNLRE
jgi:hypothetical protein